VTAPRVAHDPHLTIIERSEVRCHDTREEAELVQAHGREIAPDCECLVIPLAQAIAAPELLAACKLALRRMDNLSPEADRVRAAIAKAEAGS
jgi:hypothetical protein